MKRHFLVHFAHKLDWTDVYCQNMRLFLARTFCISLQKKWTLNKMPGEETLSAQQRQKARGHRGRSSVNPSQVLASVSQLLFTSRCKWWRRPQAPCWRARAALSRRGSSSRPANTTRVLVVLGASAAAAKQDFALCRLQVTRPELASNRSLKKNTCLDLGQTVYRSVRTRVV